MATTPPVIDPGSATPLYAQVEAVLASDIAGGTLPPGSQLPTENDLIERFGVSRAFEFCSSSPAAPVGSSAG